MGNNIYRITPRRIHATEEGRSPYYKYGVSQITGWRISQEDRYICLPKFHEDFGMFAVYDGHGGGHAVQYLYRFMHQHILTELIKHKEDPELALYLGFVTTDLCLRNMTKKELEVIEDDLDLEFEVPDKEERRHVIRQFQNISGDSPGTSKNDSSAASSTPGTSQEISQPDSATEDLKAQIASAFINELKSVKFLTQDEMEVDESDEEYDPDKDNIKLNYFGRTLDDDDEEDDDGEDDDDEEDDGEDDGEDDDVDEKEESENEESMNNEDFAKEPSGNEQSGDVGDDEESSESKETVDDQNLAKNSNKNEEQSEKEKDCDHDANTHAEQSQDCEKESKKMDDSDIEICEIPKCSTEESPSKCVNFIEPDSKFCGRTGSTATVLLLNDKKLYIANVGDSRCVACVDGQAIDLTVDHKPTKKEEKRRIYSAGGFVRDGRVSGIFDLSRTFGDFEFKKKNVAEPFQMLTCEPFITSLEISEKLEFLIIASDGIWNTMDSEDVINHVKNRMQDTHMELQDICGEMFELMLPTAVSDDGTGCDNLTAILIVFKKQSGCSTQIAGLQECYTYNYSFFTREDNLQHKKSTSVQKSTSPSLTETLKNEGQNCNDQCLAETDDNDVPLEPIPIRSPSIHSDGENEDSHPSKRFKSYHSSMDYNKQLDPHNSYAHHDNSQAYPLNLVRHTDNICDDKYENGHGESSKYEKTCITDNFLNCFQDMRNIIEITREKIKVVNNDLRAVVNEMDVKLTGWLKHPEFAHHFGGHSYFNNLNNIQERTNAVFPNVPSSLGNPNALLNSEHFLKSFASYDALPLYVGIEPPYVETSKNESESNENAPQSASDEVLVVDLSSDEDETHVSDKNEATQISDEKTSAVDNSVTKEEDLCNALQVPQKSSEEEPLREQDKMKISSSQGELKEL